MCVWMRQEKGQRQAVSQTATVEESTLDVAILTGELSLQIYLFFLL